MKKFRKLSGTPPVFFVVLEISNYLIFRRYNFDIKAIVISIDYDKRAVIFRKCETEHSRASVGVISVTTS